MSSRIFTLLLFSICSAFSSRVLVTFAHDFDSHINSIKPFFLKLVERGHNVTVLDTSSNPKPRYFGPDVHVLPIYLPPKGPKPAHDSFWIVDTASHHLPPLFAATDRVLGDIIEEHKEKLDTVLNTTWDLIIMDEVFGLHQNAISYKLKKEKNVPYIVFSTTITWMSNYINNAMGRFSSSRIGMFVPLPKDSNNFWNPSNFMHRISQFIADFREYFGICYMLSFNGDLDNLKRIASDDFTFSKFTKQSAFHLNEQIDRLPFAVPEAADFKSIGAHCRTPNALSRKYLNFMNDLSSKGTIYVGFGSTIDITFAPEFLWKAFEDTFRNLSDYRIIFAYGGERKMDVGKNVMITKWAPQLEILYHNATMLFISHAGLKSLKESVCTKTPIVYLPIFAEQSMNTRMTIELGFARTVNKHTVTSSILLREIHEILDNYTAYQGKISKLHDLFMDRMLPSLDEGAFYAERIMRGHGDRDDFKRRGIDLGWVEYMYLDLFVLFFIGFLLIK